MFDRFTSTVFSILPDPAPVRPPGFNAIDTFLSVIKWGSLLTCVCGVIIGAVMLAINHHRGEASQSFQKIAYPLLAAVIICAATALVAFIAGV